MRRGALTLVLLLLLGAAARAGWEEDLDRLTAAEPGAERDRLLGEIVKAKPDWRAVARKLANPSFPPAEAGEHVLLEKTRCADGKERPYAVVVPAGYDPSRPTPLLVVLHGGVSRPEILSRTKEYASGNALTRLAMARGWLALVPFGQKGAAWWDPVGIANIRHLVRTVKRRFDVDDDRVWLGGYSDGASAAFLLAMIRPTDYAAFLALSGHMGVGGAAGGIPTYPVNFANTPVYAATSFDDPLYPSARMRPMIEMALRAGGRLFYRELEGGHDFSYAETELPRCGDFLARHPRDPFPARIVWETARPEHGRCRWFQIDAVADGPSAPWHREWNLTLTDDRVSIGFFPDRDFAGEGVKVKSVRKETFAAACGLKAGDVVVAMNGNPVPGPAALSAEKGKVKRGDPVTLTVLRNGKKVKLTGQLPPVRRYPLFRHDTPSAAARVLFAGNRIEVEGSRLRAFRVFVHPDMIRLDRPLVIRVDGRTVFEKRVEPDLRFLLANFLAERDRKLLYVAEIRVEVPAPAK